LVAYLQVFGLGWASAVQIFSVEWKLIGLPPFDEFARVGVWKMLTVREFGGDVMLILTVNPLQDKEKEESLKKDFCSRSTGSLHKRTLSTATSTSAEKLQEVRETSEEVSENSSPDNAEGKNMFMTISNMLSLSLLIDPTFLIFAISNLLTSVGFNSPLYFLPLHATRGVGLDSASSSRVLSVFGLCNTLGRVVFGVVADHKLPLPYGLGKDTARNRLWMYNISLSKLIVEFPARTVLLHTAVYEANENPAERPKRLYGRARGISVLQTSLRIWVRDHDEPENMDLFCPYSQGTQFGYYQFGSLKTIAELHTIHSSNKAGRRIPPTLRKAMITY
ncbi:hypothetical protein ANCDUO_11037, partial [Ancylostoma duodenale]